MIASPVPSVWGGAHKRRDIYCRFYATTPRLERGMVNANRQVERKEMDAPPTDRSALTGRSAAATFKLGPSDIFVGFESFNKDTFTARDAKEKQ